MSLHRVGGRTTANSATGGPVFHIFNTHATAILRVHEAGLCQAGNATLAIRAMVVRTTGRGTPLATITPDIDHSIERDDAAGSGFVVDYTWSAVPGMDASVLAQIWIPDTLSGAGVIYVFPVPIEVPPGTGLCFRSDIAGTIGICDFTLLVED